MRRRIVTQARNFLPERKAFLLLPCFNDRTERRKQKRTVKKRVEKLFVWSISPSWRFFFRCKNRIASRKEMNRLPQRRNFSAARQFLRCRKRGKTGLRRAFSALDGVRPRANPVCPFASHSPCGADVGGGFRPHGVPRRAAKCCGNRLSAFILHSLGRARFAYFRSVPVPCPFARFLQGQS